MAKPRLRLRASARFLASIFNGVGTKVRADGLARYIDLDYSDFAELTLFDVSQKLFAVHDRSTGVWNQVAISSLIGSAQSVQIITSGDCIVQPNDGLIIINKTVGAQTAVTLPASAAKVGKVKIVDFKGDASTNNITVTPYGSETFNGGATSWVLSADTASAVFDPISGIGYAV